MATCIRNINSVVGIAESVFWLSLFSVYNDVECDGSGRLLENIISCCFVMSFLYKRKSGMT